MTAVKIGFVVQKKPHAEALAREVKAWLEQRNIEVMFEQQILAISDLTSPFPKAPPDISFVISFGGDGTFLAAVHWIQERCIPVLGINMGSLGFLTEVPGEEVYRVLGDILAGRYLIEERMLISASVIREEKEVMSQTVLNDVVINKGLLARVAHIRTMINDAYLTIFKADGLIISTPTGSTAYSLSAGGPIIYPTLHSILVTPICPFTLTNRPLVLPDNAVINANVGEQDFGSFITLDGQVGADITAHDTVIIRKASYTAHIIKTCDYNYFDVLKAKLRWSGR
ncbi:MAG: NAD(+)/NADH kinase [Pseudomonadota bacterium]